MKQVAFISALLLTINVFAAEQATEKVAEKTVMVGGAAMYPSKDIIDNAVNSNDHKTLVAAVKAAGLVDTLKSKGPFTVFAPTDEAFNKLPKGTVASLLEPKAKPKLTKILTYHVVSGNLDSAALMNLLKEGKGAATLKTVSGGKLILTQVGEKWLIKDENGKSASITIPDVKQSNGVIHVIDSVLLPK